MAITRAGTELGGAGGPVIPKFYADFMRERLWSSLYFRQLGTEVTVPRGYENVKIPRWKPPYQVSDSGSSITDNYQPKATSSDLSVVSQINEDATLATGIISAESIEGSVQIFAGAIAYTEKATIVSHASVTDGAMENLVRDLAWKLDTYTQGQISGTAVNFNKSANSDPTANATSADTLDGAVIAKIGPWMDALNVPRWEDETFVCVCHPLALYDVMTDSDSVTGFISIAKYNDAEMIYRGEVGRMFGVRFIQSNNIPLHYDATNASNLIAAATSGSHAYVVAPDAYYVIHQEGGGVSVIHHPPGSAGTNDPANLKGTVAVKVYYGVKAAPDEDHRLMWLTHAISLT